jgi:hypothetical protein
MSALDVVILCAAFPEIVDAAIVLAVLAVAVFA